jgi:hypothetical protein
MSINVSLCASFFLHEGYGFLHHDRLFKLRHFKKTSSFVGARGSRSGIAGDSVLFTHDPAWMSNRNSTSRQCSVFIFLPNVRIRLPIHVAESSLSSGVTSCSDFLCLFFYPFIHAPVYFRITHLSIKIQDCKAPLIHSSHVNSKVAAPTVRPKSLPEAIRMCPQVKNSIIER